MNCQVPSLFESKIIGKVPPTVKTIISLGSSIILIIISHRFFNESTGLNNYWTKLKTTSKSALIANFELFPHFLDTPLLKVINIEKAPWNLPGEYSEKTLMNILELSAAPEDILDQIDTMIRNLPKEEQFELYKELKSRVREGNQRSSNRKKFFNDIIFTSSRGAHHEFTKDISEGGIFIETPIPFKEGEQLTLTFPLKAHSEHIRLSGEIVRKTDIGIGIKFTPLDEGKKALLKNLIETL